jgi:hypothetical protein
MGDTQPCCLGARACEHHPLRASAEVRYDLAAYVMAERLARGGSGSALDIAQDLVNALREAGLEVVAK